MAPALSTSAASVITRLLPEPPAAPAGGSDIDHWRARLLHTILRVGVLLGAVPVLLSVTRALQTGDWHNALVALSVLGAVAAMALRPGLPTRLRTWTLIGVLYLLSIWLLVRVGAVTQTYLLVCPMLASLLLPWRAALAVLLGCTATLVLVGWGVDAELPLRGYEGQPLLKWLTVGANFLPGGALATLCGTFLLHRIERALVLQRELADQLRAEQTMLREVNAQIPGMVYRVHVDRTGKPTFVYASEGARRVFGFDPETVMADGHVLATRWHPDDRARLQAAMRKATETGEPVNVEYRLVMPDGEERWVHASSTVIHHDEHGAVRNGIIMDITERKASEALVWRQANFDALTGLPNRRMLRDRLEQAITRSKRERESVALMLIDLDHFKEVNDTLGHDGGDQLLVEAGRRIRACVRESDTVARMGGDEFTVVLPGLGTPDRVDAIANAIIARLDEVFLLGSERAFVSASIGITLFPGDGEQIEELLKNADQALYVAKENGRHGFRYFTPELQEQAQVRARLALTVRHPVDPRQSRLHYQPIVELHSGRVTKAEALIRWMHPERGMISPALFIPIAESSGLIGDVGEWVFHTAVSQVRDWRVRLDPQFQISVNRSPLQFRSDVAALDQGATGRALCKAVIVMAHELGMKVVAEGVETESQHVWLRDAGCDYAQGYWLARPMPADAFEAFVAQRALACV